MQAISPLWDIMPLTGTRTDNTAAAERTSGFTAFTDIFTSAIDAVKETNAEKVEMEYLMSTGQLDNVAQLTIAAEKELQATQLLVTLRDKALDAYDEIMRISL